GGAGGGSSASSAFPQGFLPVRRNAVVAGHGDVAFRTGGDLYVVDGSSDVAVVAASNGAVTTFAQVDNGNPVLRSIAVGPYGGIYVGGEDGRVWARAAGGSPFTLLVDTGSSPLTGLAVVPSGFGDFGGSLVAAAGSAGIIRVTTGDAPAATTLIDPPELY